MPKRLSCSSASRSRGGLTGLSGHKTDSMERRYNIVDTEDLSIAKELLEKRMRSSATVTNNVTISSDLAKPGYTAPAVKSGT